MPETWSHFSTWAACYEREGHLNAWDTRSPGHQDPRLWPGGSSSPPLMTCQRWLCVWTMRGCKPSLMALSGTSGRRWGSKPAGPPGQVFCVTEVTPCKQLPVRFPWVHVKDAPCHAMLALAVTNAVRRSPHGTLFTAGHNLVRLALPVASPRAGGRFGRSKGRVQGLGGSLIHRGPVD